MLPLEGIEYYNNQGALIGIDCLDDIELLGALKKMSPVKRQKTINQLSQNPHPSKGSRAEMEKRFKELPGSIREGLYKGDLRLADFIGFSIKPLNSKTIKLFEPQDDKQTGIRNIGNAKLPKNQVMLVHGIQLLVGIATDSTTDNISACNFTSIEGVPALVSGEFTLTANRKQIIPDTSNTAFRTSNYQTVPQGYYQLANPRIIMDDILIEWTLELGTQTGIAANTFVFAALWGTITTP